jgi:hypothetical protein
VNWVNWVNWNERATPTGQTARVFRSPPMPPLESNAERYESLNQSPSGRAFCLIHFMTCITELRRPR